MRYRLLLALLAGLWLCCAASIAVAKGPADKATLAGPGLATAIEIADPADLAALGFLALEQVETNGRAGVTPPADPGPAFLLTRYLRQPDGRYRAWDELHYYPAAGTPGLIFFDGLVGSSSTEFDGKWYPATPAGDAALRRILARHGAMMLPVAGAAGTPWALLLAAAAAGAGGLALRRTAARR